MQNSSLSSLHNDICSFDKLLMGSQTGGLLEQPSLGVNGKDEVVMFIVQKKIAFSETSTQGMSKYNLVSHCDRISVKRQE